ncbi:MAG TPA: hypothetical protein VLS89_18855, partial [Candidatus Nanopelagicales bacterium]|nr:hypothetical protein [Candidatus Nanopelagicales bacterium]
AAKKVPNPNGRKGSIPHQDKVSEVAKDIEARGLKADTEYHVKTPGRKKADRFVDVVGFDDKKKRSRDAPGIFYSSIPAKSSGP